MKMRINGILKGLPDHTNMIFNNELSQSMVIIPENLQENMLLLSIKNVLNKYHDDPIRLSNLLESLIKHNVQEIK